MDAIPFLEYLAERTATQGLAAGLAEILVLRNRRDLVPAEILRAPLHVDRQVASRPARLTLTARAAHCSPGTAA